MFIGKADYWLHRWFAIRTSSSHSWDGVSQAQPNYLKPDLCCREEPIFFGVTMKVGLRIDEKTWPDQQKDNDKDNDNDNDNDKYKHNDKYI